jgi:hypothetical protein
MNLIYTAPMKKWSTLIFIVKEFSVQQIKNIDFNSQEFLTDSDDNAEFSPSAQSIRNIMDFANSYKVLNSNSTGQIELITN